MADRAKADANSPTTANIKLINEKDLLITTVISLHPSISHPICAKDKPILIPINEDNGNNAMIAISSNTIAPPAFLAEFAAPATLLTDSDTSPPTIGKACVAANFIDCTPAVSVTLESDVCTVIAVVIKVIIVEQTHIKVFLISWKKEDNLPLHNVTSASDDPQRILRIGNI